MQILCSTHSLHIMTLQIHCSTHSLHIMTRQIHCSTHSLHIMHLLRLFLVLLLQARDDVHSNWITLELRYDRAYQTFSKAVFAGIHNLCVLCGDAMTIIPTHMPSSVLDHVFVNHPEPPQQVAGKGGSSQGNHLLDEVRASFLPIYLSTYLPTYRPIYLSTYLPTFHSSFQSQICLLNCTVALFIYLITTYMLGTN